MTSIRTHTSAGMVQGNMQTPPVAGLGIVSTGKMHITSTKGCFSPLKNKKHGLIRVPPAPNATISPVPSSDKRKRRACSVSDNSLREIL
eukprot:11263801-Ditylum_brightwellii.AAC.1